MRLKFVFVLFALFFIAVFTHAYSTCCNPAGTCTCTSYGSCSYTCNSGFYNCDGNSANGCESDTPCNQYTFQRFTFDLSDYNLNEIISMKYCFEGYYTGSGTAKLQYYNVTSASWVDDQSLDTSESVKCKTFTTGLEDVVNQTSKIFQFAARGYTGSSGSVVIYTDNVNLTLSRSAAPAVVEWVDGAYGSAILFDGSNYITSEDSPSLDMVNQLTIEAWVRPSTVNPAAIYQTILHKGNSSAENYGLYLKNDELYFEWINGGTYSAETTEANLQPDAWSHVAAVFNYSGNSIKLYVNGEEKGISSTPAALLPNEFPLAIGGHGSGAYYFNGTIDEVAIYSRAKSAEEIYADAHPLYISLDVRDALNNSVSIGGASSGYINPGGNNTFHLKLDGGSLNVTAGDYSGLYSLRIYSNSTRANLLIKTVQEGVSSIKAILPVQVTIYGQLFRNLILAEK
ncbi:MAG: LamG domain-containing protein [Candidatus Micrarchaeia archaeon]